MIWEAAVTLETASEVNSMLHGYALTVHKSQGAEWEKVFVMLHQSHATMLQRELLYTALTRARSEVYVICEPDTFVKGVLSQKIKGNTLAEKAEFFKGRYLGNGMR
jgi:exodeoxyribonuclease V alpha subunit